MSGAIAECWDNSILCCIKQKWGMWPREALANTPMLGWKRCLSPKCRAPCLAHNQKFKDTPEFFSVGFSHLKIWSRIQWWFPNLLFQWKKELLQLTVSEIQRSTTVVDLNPTQVNLSRWHENHPQRNPSQSQMSASLKSSDPWRWEPSAFTGPLAGSCEVPRVTMSRNCRDKPASLKIMPKHQECESSYSLGNGPRG